MTAQTALAPQRVSPSIDKALRTLHRFEVGPMYVFVLLWGEFVAADKPSDLWTLAAILAFLINGLSLFSGFVLNAYSDYPIDRRSALKGYIADAVEAIGRPRVLTLYVVEQAVTIGMAAVISMLLNNWAFVAVKFGGIMTGYLYNAEPIRLKRHGLWNPVMMGLRFGFVPGLIAYLAVHGGSIGLGGWLLLIGMTLVSSSRGFWNAVSDTEEDRAEDIRTPAVVYGPRWTMQVAVLVLVPASILLIFGFLDLFGAWSITGAFGCIGATAYRMDLVRRAPDDRSAVSLLRTLAIRRVDARWAKATYVVPLLVGALHWVIR